MGGAEATIWFMACLGVATSILGHGGGLVVMNKVLSFWMLLQEIYAGPWRWFVSISMNVNGIEVLICFVACVFVLSVYS